MGKTCPDLGASVRERLDIGLGRDGLDFGHVARDAQEPFLADRRVLVGRRGDEVRGRRSERALWCVLDEPV